MFTLPAWPHDNFAGPAGSGGAAGCLPDLTEVLPGLAGVAPGFLGTERGVPSSSSRGCVMAAWTCNSGANSLSAIVKCGKELCKRPGARFCNGEVSNNSNH